MKIKVLKMAGQTGFRTVGTVYNLWTPTAKQLIKLKIVEKVVKKKPVKPTPVKD